MAIQESAGRNDSIAAHPTANERSIWSIIIGVFSGPAEAFEAHNRRPRIIVVLLVSIILGMIISGFTAEFSARMQYDLASKSTTIPPQVLENLKSGYENPDRISGAIMGPIFQLVIGLVISLLAWMMGSFIMGGDSTFKRIWGVTLLGGLIGQLGGLVKMPLMMAKDSIYVSFGLAVLFPGKDFTSIVYSLLYYFDAFMIWGIIVTGIGYATVFGISRGKGYAISFILSFLGVAALIGLMLIGMSFLGVEISFF